MKHPMKQLIMSVCTCLLLGNTHFAAADTASDTEKLLNWAENTYPQYFPTHQVTQNIEPWIYRFYPETGVYAGVNKTDNNVYALGGPWGNTPALIDTLPNLVALAGSGNSSIPACNTVSAPAGMHFTQNGNIVNITTDGCIALPISNNVCQVPHQTAATGISVLTSNNVTSSTISGITIDLPGIPNPFESFANSFSNSKHCTINVPAEGANLIVHTDVCYDMTAQFSGGLEGIPGITINPPITMARKDTTTNQVVPDCFATDADTVFNAVTNESWTKVNGAFVKQ